MTKACAIPKCKTGSRSVKQKISVFRVPKNIERYKKWQEAIPYSELKQSQYVCEKHFEEKYIIRQWIKRDANGLIIAQSTYTHPRLDESAVPTIFEGNAAMRQSAASIVDKCTDPLMDNVLGITKFPKFLNVSIEGPSPLDVVEPESAHNTSQEAILSQFIRHEDIPPQNSVIQPVFILPHKLVQQVVPPQESIKQETLDLDEFVKHEVLLPLEAASTVSNMQDCAAVNSVSAVHERNFEISNITINDRSNEVAMSTENSEKCAITIPKSWGVTELSTEKGQRIVFSHLVIKRENGMEVPVIEKSVMVNTDKTLHYCVYGREIDPEGYKLASILNDTILLLESLKKFKNTNVCNGLGAINVHHLSVDSVFKDYVDRWHQNDCTLLSKRKRCDGCMKMRQRILQREKRSEENRTISRVFRAYNPTDQKKLVALRKKCYRERRLKNLAKQRGQLLRQSLRDKIDEIERIRAETLHERCLGLNLPAAQKAALMKIISAASKKGTYSNE